MERSTITSISVLVLACLLGSAAAQSAGIALAHFDNMFAKEKNWSMAGVGCSKEISGMPYEWRSKYYWTNVGGGVGGTPRDCGKCINVTNPANKKVETVRIVGPTGLGLELDRPAWDYLEPEDPGRSFNVSFKFVDCHDAPAPAPAPEPEPLGPGESNVVARWANYISDPDKDSSYADIPLECAILDGGTSLEWRKRYGWTAYCGIHGSTADEICGKCLKVTNKKTNAVVTVRIMDKCGEGTDTLVLDEKTAFNVIDTDGSGHFDGSLKVDYNYTTCDDPVPVLGVYSE